MTQVYLLGAEEGGAAEGHLAPTFSGLVLGAADAQAVPSGHEEQGEPGGLDGEKVPPARGNPESGSSSLRASACSPVLWCNDWSEPAVPNRWRAAAMLVWYLR